MKLVGEAVSEELHKYSTNLTVLGIATWGTLKHRENLVNPVCLINYEFHKFLALFLNIPII